MPEPSRPAHGKQEGAPALMLWASALRPIRARVLAWWDVALLLASGFSLVELFSIGILPAGFHRIRYYGFLASQTRARNITRAETGPGNLELVWPKLSWLSVRDRCFRQRISLWPLYA
jgi:hypothetical protein